MLSAGNWYIVNTSNQLAHKQFWFTTEASHLRLYYQSCESIKLVLATDLFVTETNSYSVILGGGLGQKSMIHRGLTGEVLVTGDTPDIKGCDVTL